MKDKKSLIRSSSAEYLTYIAATGDGGVEAIYADENILADTKNDGYAVQCRNAYS